MNGPELGSRYTAEELREMLGSVGENVSLNRSVVLYGAKNIHVGSNVRIDCFCVLSAGSTGIVIGDYVHIAAYTALFGSGGKIQLDSFSGLSSRVSVYTGTEDYMEGFLGNPTIPGKYRKVTSGNVVLKKHALVGTGSVIMPGVTLELGASVGALSFVNRDVPEFSVAVGIPCRIAGRRSRRLLELETALRAESDPAAAN
jgi:acetyltransferase-like isoleucine patch superfamily enzyme